MPGLKCITKQVGQIQLRRRGDMPPDLGDTPPPKAESVNIVMYREQNGICQICTKGGTWKY